MSKNMQNLVLLMEPSEDDYEISLRAGNMCLNRFCLDEDNAFELSGIYYLEKSSKFMTSHETEFEVERKLKGMRDLS